MSSTVPVRAVVPPTPSLPRRSSSPFSSFRQVLPRASPYEPSVSSYSPTPSLSRPSRSHHHPAHAPLQHDVKGVHVSSPTQCPTPTSSLTPYSRYDVSPILAPHPHPPAYPFPPPLRPPVLALLPHPQYYQTQPLTQAPTRPSPPASLWRATAPYLPPTSSRTSAAYDFESSRSLSSSSVSYRPVSRSASTRGPHHPPIERIDEDPVPVVAQAPAAPVGVPAAQAQGQQPQVATDGAWSVYFLSLPASPVFLQRLSVALMAWHAALLCVSLVLFLVVALTSSAFGDLLSVYLLVYGVKSAVSLAMVVYRYRHVDCWRYEDPILSSVRSQRFHVLDHAVRCVGVAAAGVVSWLLFSGVTGGVGTLVGKVVLGLLCVEYVGVVLPVVCNLGLSFFVPCIHLSFYLPYLPFPSVSTASHPVEEDKAGMTEDDLSALPMTKYRPSKRGEDATCAVCLAEVEVDEEVRVLSCRHFYHKECIDSWLRKRGVCPLCVRKVSVHRGGKAAGQREEVKVEMVATPTVSSPVTSEASVDVVVEVVHRVDATYAGRVEVDALAGTEELRRVA